MFQMLFYFIIFFTHDLSGKVNLTGALNFTGILGSAT